MSKLNDKIDEFFKKEEQSLESIFNQIFAHICLTEFSKTDIYYLCKIVTYEQLEQIAKYYNGDTIRTPTNDELRECYYLTICFFLKEELNWDWGKIKEYLDVKNGDFFSSLSLGKKITGVKDKMKKDLQYMVKKLTKDDLYQLLTEARKWIPKN